MAQTLNQDDFARSLLRELDQILIAPEAASSAVAERIARLLGRPISEFVSTGNPELPKEKRIRPSDFAAGKKTLHIRPHSGQFFKRCPGSSQKTALTCCNYYILNLGSQCRFDCSYCYLQSYLSQPEVQIFSNIDQALQELEASAGEFQQLPLRVGTGEITDSLNLDPVTLYSHKLIDFFRQFPKWTLEFKTKSDFVDQFLNEPHAGNILVSWSINPAAVVDHEEHGTASLQRRLAAARKCIDAGFPVAFHIDPMIAFHGWKQHYQDLVDTLLASFKPEEVNVISLGSLRFQGEQKHIHRERFGMNSWVSQGEFFPSDSGKWRYDAQLRQEMSQLVIHRFKQASSKWRIFLCMETPETWIASLDTSSPLQRSELQDLFRPLPL